MFDYIIFSYIIQSNIISKCRIPLEKYEEKIVIVFTTRKIKKSFQNALLKKEQKNNYDYYELFNTTKILSPVTIYLEK